MGQCASRDPPLDNTNVQSGESASLEINYDKPIAESPLKPSEIKSRARCVSGSIVVAGRTLHYGTVCFRGYYPDTPMKRNQDNFLILDPEAFGNDSASLFGVFDGHGEFGDKCADFSVENVKSKLPEKMQSITEPLEGEVGENALTDETMIDALKTSFIEVNEKLHQDAIEDDLSGTTAICALFLDNTIWVANLGDSRCVLYKENGNDLLAEPLSMDQTPYRKDERTRCRACGARIMNMDQMEGLEKEHDNWEMGLGEEIDEEGNPPRIWSKHGDYPGAAFTRSIGDAIAEDLGVYAEPEITKHAIGEDDRLLIIASDGVWEFLTNKTVGTIVSEASSPFEAACLLWRAAFKMWISKEVRTDDITVTVVDLHGHFNFEDNVELQPRTSIALPKKATTRRGSLANQKKIEEMIPSEGLE